MKGLNEFPDWACDLFVVLCFHQVRDQISENLIYHKSNPPSFICNGQLFAYTHASTFIPDEPAIVCSSLGFTYDYRNN